MRIILASSSPYRKELFARLRLAFESTSPDIDETPHEHEDPIDLVNRLAKEKALTVLSANPDALTIGSDTLVSFGQTILGKPHTFEEAVRQIKSMLGKTVMFYTSVCVACQDKTLLAMVPTKVVFKDDVSDSQIERYCSLEEPFYSCGAFKSETSVVALITQMQSDDPTAIVGLPLIKLSEMLTELGVEILP